MRYVDDARLAVLAAARDMAHRGLTEGTAGNVSARRHDGTVVVTPSSVDYDQMEVDDLVVVDAGGNVLEAKDGRSPTSELSLHLACLRAFDDVGSVVHSHPVHATMFAVARRPIPCCIDEFAVYVGGEVRVTPYAKSGTPQVGEHAVAALEGRAAALIANHGMVAVGSRPETALKVTALVERAAQIVLGAERLGAAHALPDDVNQEFARIYTQFVRGTVL